MSPPDYGGLSKDDLSCAGVTPKEVWVF